MKKRLVHNKLTSKSKSNTYQLGGFGKWMQNNSAGVGAAAGGLAGMFGQGDEYGVRSTGGALASGALSGAAAGASLGPLGLAGGALIGGVTSLFKNNKAKEEAVKQKEVKRNLSLSKQIQDSEGVLASYDNKGTGITSFQMGGIQVGNGMLKPVADSGETLEVQGDNPEFTDDVAVGDAFVDHGETVKPVEGGMKILSDTLKVPGTKLTFAKADKKLEKQKSIDGSREAQDNLIKQKQEQLFNLQQSLNNNNTGETTEEAMLPKGRQPGAGFSTGNMFKHGGLSPVNAKYHNMNPKLMGLNSPAGLGSKVMNYKKGGKYDSRQLAMGVPIEAGEHKKSLLQATTIAKQHLSEDPKYYTKLKAAGLQMGGFQETSDASLLPAYQMGGLNTSTLNIKDQTLAAMARTLPGQIEKKPDMLTKLLGPPSSNARMQSAAKSGLTRTGFQVGGFNNQHSRMEFQDLINKNLPVTMPKTTTGVDLNAMNQQGMDLLNPGARRMEVASAGNLPTGGAFDVVTGQPNLPVSKSKKPMFGNMNASNALGAIGTLAPAFANLSAARKLPEVAVPTLTKAARLRTPDFSDQTSALKEANRVGIQAARQNSVMGQAQDAVIGDVTANTMRATNQLHGDINRTKTSIYNQQAMIGQQNNMYNNELLNQYNANRQARASNIMGLQSQARADISNKALGLLAQDNVQKLDEKKLGMQRDYFNWAMNGGADRHAAALGISTEQLLKMQEEEKQKSGKKNGGLLRFKGNFKVKKRY